MGWGWGWGWEWLGHVGVVGGMIARIIAFPLTSCRWALRFDCRDTAKGSGAGCSDAHSPHPSGKGSGWRQTESTAHPPERKWSAEAALKCTNVMKIRPPVLKISVEGYAHADRQLCSLDTSRQGFSMVVQVGVAARCFIIKARGSWDHRRVPNVLLLPVLEDGLDPSGGCNPGPYWSMGSRLARCRHSGQRTGLAQTRGSLDRQLAQRLRGCRSL